MFIPTGDLVIPTGIQTNEANAEIQTFEGLLVLPYLS